MATRRPRRLTRSFFNRDAKTVAHELIGKTMYRHTSKGIFQVRIVETEAYVGVKDKACHASKGYTPRTSALFGPPGHIYIYLIYGMYHMLNFVTAEEGNPHAVLIRGVEPLFEPTKENKFDGPGKLTKTLSITQDLNKLDLCANDELTVHEGSQQAPIVATSRIGVDYAGIWAKRKLRFLEKNNPYVSVPISR